MMQSKSRVLFLLHIPPPVHGSSIVGLNIMESKLINTEFDCDFINLLASKNVADSGKINISKLFGFIKTIILVCAQLLRARPKLCYLALSTTGAAFYKDLILIVLLKLFGVKLVYHLHNKGISTKQRNALSRLCYRYVFKDAAVIILSANLYRDIEAFVSQSNVYVCPNGIADGVLLAETSHLPNQSGAVKILFLSNLIKSKGIIVLLKALSALKQDGISFMCDLVGGEGDLLAPELEKMKAELNLNDVVVYHGKQFGASKNLTFRAADIFVLPTFYSNECFPLVLLEAMSFSLPVISTHEGGIPDIVAEGVTGFLVNKNDPTDLASKLSVLIHEKKTREMMGNNGRIKFEKQYTLNHFERNMKDILSKIMG